MLKKPPTSQWLNKAISLHQQNRTTEARGLYERILRLHPNDPDANHLLGLIDQKDGNTDLALKRLIKARRCDPDNAELLSNLGNLYRTLGRREEAISTFKAGLAIKPGLSVLHNNLGVAYQEAERHQEAVASFQTALKRDADYAEAHNNLASSLVALGQPDKAVPSFLKAISLVPNYAKALANLQATLVALDASEQGAMRTDPSAPSSLVRDAYDRLGQIHFARKALVPALAAFENALKRAPDNYDIAHRRLDCLIKLKRPAEMVAALEKLIAIAPDESKLHALLGQAYGQLGHKEASIDSLKRAVALDPDNSGAYQMLARAISLKTDDALVTEMNKAYDRAAPDGTDRMRLAFSLAKAKEDQSAYRQGFAYLLEANRIRHDRLNFEPEDARRRAARLRAVFTPEFMGQPTDIGDDDSRPIFIIGMPRSGTTLVESILAAHGAVQPCGELNVMIDVAARQGLRDRGQPPLFEPIGANARFDRLARAYLDGVEKNVPAAALSARFTDKMPDNFWNTGLIRRAFPKATIIHCRRSPADTCLSIFKTDFSNSGHRYAYDLKDLGVYYNLYRDTMRHWDEVLPKGSVQTIDYEDLVVDPEQQTRRLLEMCALDWDDNCLSFFASKHAVHTASLYQVRQPVYASSVNLADAYGDCLDPLFTALDGPDAAAQKNSA